MQSRTRLRAIGAGWPGQRHASGIRASPDAVLQALAEPNDNRAAEVGTTSAPTTLHSDYRDLLGEPADAVVMRLPHHLQFPGFASRWPASSFPGASLGTIYFAEAVWVQSRGVPTGLGGWFTDKQRSGGGTLVDIRIHTLDSAWYRPASVPASVSKTSITWLKPRFLTSKNTPLPSTGHSNLRTTPTRSSKCKKFDDAIRRVAAPINNAQRALYLMEMLDAICLSSSSQRELPIAQA